MELELKDMEVIKVSENKEEVLIGDRLLHRWFDKEQKMWKVVIFERVEEKWVEIVHIEASKKYKFKVDDIFNEHLELAKALAEKGKQSKLFELGGS